MQSKNREGGKIVSLTYGQVAALHLDPIEKNLSIIFIREVGFFLPEVMAVT